MVDVTDGPDVDMGLVSYELFFGHLVLAIPYFGTTSLLSRVKTEWNVGPEPLPRNVLLPSSFDLPST